MKKFRNQIFKMKKKKTKTLCQIYMYEPEHSAQRHNFNGKRYIYNKPFRFYISYQTRRVKNTLHYLTRKFTQTYNTATSISKHTYMYMRRGWFLCGVVAYVYEHIRIYKYNFPLPHIDNNSSSQDSQSLILVTSLFQVCTRHTRV